MLAGTTAEVVAYGPYPTDSCYVTLPGTRVFRTRTSRLLHHSHTVNDSDRAPGAYLLHFYRYQLDALVRDGVVSLF